MPLDLTSKSGVPWEFPSRRSARIPHMSPSAFDGNYHGITAETHGTTRRAPYLVHGVWAILMQYSFPGRNTIFILQRGPTLDHGNSRDHRGISLSSVVYTPPEPGSNEIDGTVSSGIPPSYAGSSEVTRETTGTRGEPVEISIGIAVGAHDNGQELDEIATGARENHEWVSTTSGGFSRYAFRYRRHPVVRHEKFLVFILSSMYALWCSHLRRKACSRDLKRNRSTPEGPRGNLHVDSRGTPRNATISR